MAEIDILRVMSYNCRGMNFIKTQYVKTLLDVCDFLFIGYVMNKYRH